MRIVRAGWFALLFALSSLAVATPPCLIASLVASPQTARFTEDGRALVVNGRSYPIEEPHSFAFEGGVLGPQEPDRLVLDVDGRVAGAISLRTAAIPWLKQAHVRILGGMRFALTQCLALDAGGALGVVTVRAPHSIMLDEGGGPSPEVELPVVAQFLVRLFNRPLRLELLKSLSPAGESAPLDGSEGDPGHWDPVRLLRVRGRLYCIGNGAIDSIDSSGRTTGTVGRWRKDVAPIGVSADRWIIGERYFGSGYELWATDLVRRKTFCLYRRRSSEPPYNYNPYVEFAGVSPTSDFILVHATYGSDTPGGGGQEVFTLHLPDGKRRSMKGIWPIAVWGPYAVGGDPSSGNLLESLRQAVFYSAATGRLVHVYRR